METRIQAVRICHRDIGMEFRIEKYAMLIIKLGNHTWQKEWTYETKKK